MIPHRVKHLGDDQVSDAQVNWGSNADHRGLLKKGEIYDVYDIKVHSYHTEVYLAKYPNKPFNSVCFEDVETEDD